MYNCHLDTQPGDLGPFKGCYSVTSTERSFTPRSKKRLETSKHPLNGDSDILFESIKGWSEKQDKTSKQTDHQTNHYTIEAEAYIIYHEASVTSYIYEIQLKIIGPFDDVNESWPLQKNTWPRTADTWTHDMVRWYWSADTLFWQLSIDHNIDVQHVGNMSFRMLPNELQSVKLNIGFPVVQTDRQCMVTWLPNFLGWVDLLTHGAPAGALRAPELRYKQKN